MNKRNKVVAVITSILLAASMASLSIPAQAEQNTDVCAYVLSRNWTSSVCL